MEYKTTINSFYFYQYLFHSTAIDNKYMDLIKYELDKRMYLCGNHFKANNEKYSSIKFYVYLFIKIIFVLLNKLLKRKSDRSVIISSAYSHFNDELRKLGYKVVFPELNIGNRHNYFGNIRILLKYEYIKRGFRKENLNTIINDNFKGRINDLRSDLIKYLISHNVKALFVANDMAFLEKMLIDIFKEIRKPSYVYLHGLPSRYNHTDDNRADYLLVWGNKIKENYIRSGVRENKILSIGHSFYKNISKNKLRFEYSDILIITQSIPGAPEDSEQLLLQDRGNILYYLWTIKDVLTKLKVTSVRFRPHPSENPKWYLNNLDNKFFQLDKSPLYKSLQAATLVIGPTSTVFLEAIQNGVNYLVYEPCIQGRNLKNQTLFPPFDGLDPRIPVAKNQDDLYNYLVSQCPVDVSIYNELVGQPLDSNSIKNLPGINEELR